MANRKTDQDKKGRRVRDPKGQSSRPGGLDEKLGGYRGKLGAGNHTPGRPARARRGNTTDTENYKAPDTLSFQQNWSAPGPQAGSSSRGERRADEELSKDVRGRLAQHGQVDDTGIEVEVKEGHVWLRGKIPDNRAKRIAELAIEAIPGVIDVHNELELGQTSEVQ